MYVLGAILALGLLIIVHEAGHFFVGRWCGMRIERFSIGFGPGLVKWKSKKGTLFQIAPVPFGGFVEIKGMNIAEDVDPDDKEAYPNRPVWQRIATIFAGPGTNYLTAVVLAFGLYTCVGAADIAPRYKVGTVDASYPAADVLKPGDEIIAVDGKEIWWHGPNGETSNLAKLTDEAKGKPLALTIVRGGQRQDVTVGTKFDDTKDIQRWRMGIAFDGGRTKLGVLTAGKEAIVYPWRQTRDIVGGIYGGLKAAFQGKKSGLQAQGPIGIGQTFTHAFEAGFVVVIELLMLLNVYLGLFNLLPLPALDGGRLAFLGYELVARRRANPRVEMTVTMVGVLFLIVLMVFVTFKDIAHL